MKRLALALGVAISVLALSGTASAQYYPRSYNGGSYVIPGQAYYHPGHYHQHYNHTHYHPGHYHYTAPQVIYPAPRYIQPYSYPSYPSYYGGSTFSFGYARPGLSLGLSFIR